MANPESTDEKNAKAKLSFSVNHRTIAGLSSFKIIFSLALVILASKLYSQDLINLRIVNLPYSDSIYLDSLSVVPGSVKAYSLDYDKIKSSNYKIDYSKSLIKFKPDFNYYEDSIKIKFRVFPYNFNAEIYNYRKEDFLRGGTLDDSNYGFTFSPSDYRQTSYYSETSLSRRGSISRGISFGNNQDAIVNSNLDLQLEGKLSENLNVVAVITDSNIPIQPDGSSQQIHEFDKVFINLFSDNISLTLGDFELRKPDGYFMNYMKRAQGIKMSAKLPKNEERNYSVESSVSGSIAKGKNHRMEIQGIEGNQGPYRLRGANNETYIVVLAGSERVYIDGMLMTRGQDNDYVIDYNLGEITFTSRQAINQDKRIIVEFEYSDRNYARFLFTNTNKIKTENSNFYINIFSENDSKNQTFDQDLRDQDKLMLSLIGDNIDQALIPGFDSVGFAGDEIRYAMTDTVVDNITYDSVFVFSNDENIAHYRIRFALVGQNKGDYVRSVSSANGRVFKWVAPVNGVPQGDYMPMRLIVTPKKSQMISIGGNTKIGNSTSIDFETGISNRDINTFSELDADNNVGAAFKIQLNQRLLKTQNNLLNSKVRFENVRENFNAIEHYRSPEFRRDWNLENTYSDKHEYISSFNLNYLNHNYGTAEYNLQHLNRLDMYEGLKHNVNLNFNTNKWNIFANASLLNSEDNFNNTRFLRHRAGISRDVGIFVIGLAEEQEYNKWTNPAGDSLRNNSFNYNQIELFVKTNDSIKNASSIKYKYRENQLPKNNQLANSTTSQDLSVNTTILSGNNHRFSAGANYRQLQVIDTDLYSDKPEDNMTGRLEYSFRLFSGALNSNSFYEIGSGLERKIEFSFLEVAPGQGVYKWTDYNNNGIQELDEFEIAHHQDEANYIRVISPTDEYIKTYSNMFNQQLNLNPGYLWRNETGVKGFIARFSNQLAYRLSSKNTSSELAEFANPFNTNIDDINLVSMTSSIRNSLGFNRSNPKFNMEYIYSNNNNKMLLVSGFDTRISENNSILLNSRVLSNILLQNRFNFGENAYESEFFDTRNYNLSLYSNDISLGYQPNVNNRVTINYLYQIKENQTGTEDLTGHNFGLEYRMSSVNKGTFNMRVNYVYFDFYGETNSPIAYEMLEGLMPGSNITWNLGFQRQLANGLQINLNYDGRKNVDGKAIHTGGMQVRAFF